MRLQTRLFYAGLLILIAGIGCSVAIYVFSPEEEDRATEVTSSPGYEFQLERLGGKGMVYMARLHEWLASLWHGKHLAFTSGALSLAIALLFFWRASVVSRRAAVEHNDDRPHPG